MPFKIENFCIENNKLFKKYYNYLNNPFYVAILLNSLQYIEHERVKNKIYNMIIENHESVLDKLNKIDIIISFYKKNNLINKSEIGKFFTFYEKHRKETDINDNKDLLKLFYKLILYENCISVLKECFYIFSNYRACIYFLTPSIDFNNTDKNTMNDVIKNFKDNTNTLTQIISKVYIGDKNEWGILYSSANAMFETLLIINKFYEPLKKIGIQFENIKMCDKKNILKNLCKNYNQNKFNNININTKEINNVSEFIIKLKKFGYDMWYTIPLVFDTIYEDYNLNNIMESNVIGYNKVYHQKMNNKIGVMCYILVRDGFISNVNIFQRFNM